MLIPTAVLAATTAPSVQISFGILIAIIFVALIFDFLNGFHDAANSIATIVSTRVLSPTTAVLWAAFFNFVAAFIFGTKVSSTIAKDLVDNTMIDINVVTAGLVGAIIWNIITWFLGLPTSSSHALVGGIGGAAVLKSGFQVLKPTGWTLILLGIILAPTIGFVLGMLNMVIVSWIIHALSGVPNFVRKRRWLAFLQPVADWIGSWTTPSRVDQVFRKLQLVSAALYSLGHGGNDAQKTMGVIVMLLVAGGYGHYVGWDPAFLQPMNQYAANHNIGWWIILLCHMAIALGTCFGGWRIVKTMGSGITRLQPIGGFCAETAAAIAIFGFTKIRGVPISTTHAITGAILGVGTTKSVRSVRWIWGQRIVMAWILTIPCSAFVAGLTYLFFRFVFPLQGH